MMGICLEDLDLIPMDLLAGIHMEALLLQTGNVLCDKLTFFKDLIHAGYISNCIVTFSSFGRDPYRGEGPPPVSPRGPGYGPGGPMNPPGGSQQGAVMMAYGLSHEKMNCDKLFNVLCLYGNIVRVSNTFV